MSRVLLVSDQPVLLGGFEQVLESRGFEVTACDTSSLPLGTTAEVLPDLVLMDITAGLTLGDLSAVNGRLPGCPVVLWAETMPLDTVFRALEFGVRGIVERSSSAEHLSDALRRVAGGEMQIGFAASHENIPTRRRLSLTPREREIVTFLRQGLRNKQIAAEMGITEGTVKIYLFRLFHKLGVRNRFELARCSATDGLLEPPPRIAASARSGPASHAVVYHNPARLT